MPKVNVTIIDICTKNQIYGPKAMLLLPKVKVTLVHLRAKNQTNYHSVSKYLWSSLVINNTPSVPVLMTTFLNLIAPKLQSYPNSVNTTIQLQLIYITVSNNKWWNE